MSALQEQNDGEEFFYYEKLFLKIFGIWTTDNSTAYKIYSFVVFIAFTWVYYFMLWYEIVTQNFYEIIDLWTYFIGYTIMIYFNLSWRFESKKICEFLQKIGQKDYIRNYRQKDTFEYATLSKWHHYKNVYGGIYMGALIFSMILHGIDSFISRYTNTDPNKWKYIYGAVQVVDVRISPNFEIFSIYQCASMVFTIIPFATNSVFIIGNLNFVAAQFIILQNDLRTMVVDDDARMLNEKIKNFVNAHLRVLNFVKEVLGIYGKDILIMFALMLALICLDVFRMSEVPINDMANFRFFEEILAGFQTVFFISWASENIEIENEQLTKSVYDVDFVGAGAKLPFQKSLIIILQQTQKPIGVKCAGIMNVSMITFTGIVRTIYSTYTMLKTVRSDD
ncbi:hypothetical protein FQR65_LT03524 [Abscondita terminalis]|nr:hypothetical protein FQR65_LT03524 [Abscondita terminalis]